MTKTRTMHNGGILHKSGARALALTAFIAALALIASGCGLQSASGAVLQADPGKIKHYDSLDGVEVTVAAKEYTEALVLGNMFSIVLNTAGMKVTNHSNTPGSNSVRNALVNGSAQVEPDYTGTGWITYLGNAKPVKGEKEQFIAVRDADKKNGITWLPPSPENNTYAFAMGPEAAKKFKIKKLSQIKDLPKKERTFCVESEFKARNDGFQPMLKTYGLTLGKDVPKSQVTTLDTGAVYQATGKGKCNFGEVFTTDGRILALKLKVLEDDKEFFPKYNMTSVVRTKFLKENPAIKKVFATLLPKVTNKVMLKLNAQVDVDGRQPALVALDWLKDAGMVK